jgi:energy-coupling factor transport system permease protein
MPLSPLAFPPLPLAAVLGLLVGALPAYLTPEPPRPASRVPQRGAREEVNVGG